VYWKVADVIAHDHVICDVLSSLCNRWLHRRVAEGWPLGHRAGQGLAEPQVCSLRQMVNASDDQVGKGTGQSEFCPVDHRDLDMARVQDRACENKHKNSEAALSPPEDKKMTFPEWTKPGVYGAIVGAVAATILGFAWGGWTTGGNAEKMAKSFASDEVTRAMVPVCLDMSAADPERVAKLATIQDATGFNRRRAVMDTGWATLPGTEAPNRDLAVACIEGLELDAS